EPGATASADKRCDGFSPNLWGAGVYTFKVYCHLSLSPGEGIAVTAGAFDKGPGWTSAASVSIAGNVLEIKAP
ncbi:MAG TPA: hypothetical protein VMP03_14040, partial [Methylomirabilota bacterium]|nr:hypothetical protein [Methylomirabilota bacterium]